MSDIENLRSYLGDSPRADFGVELDRLLSAVWPLLSGSGETSMASWKIGRGENFSWSPPELTFTIERHGAAALGSTRAEIQHWIVNLDTLLATPYSAGTRQIRPRQAALDVRPMATKVGVAINAGNDEPWLSWTTDGQRVRVLVGQLIPDASGPRATVTGRRRRFNAALVGVLGTRWVKSPGGWWARRPAGD